MSRRSEGSLTRLYPFWSTRQFRATNALLFPPMLCGPGRRSTCATRRPRRRAVHSIPRLQWAIEHDDPRPIRKLWRKDQAERISRLASLEADNPLKWPPTELARHDMTQELLLIANCDRTCRSASGSGQTSISSRMPVASSVKQRNRKLRRVFRRTPAKSRLTYSGPYLRPHLMVKILNVAPFMVVDYI